MNACCIGCISPSVARPSMVVTSQPSACTASTVQLFTASPFEVDAAGAARRGVAADVGAGEAEHLAHVVDEQRSTSVDRRRSRICMASDFPS
jgi:hypothetical protein